MSSAESRPTTRADVARLAGVSTAVVSYVVNDGPRPVASATRRKVLDAIRELDYHPNPSARALKTGSTGLIGVVVPEILNSYFSEFVDAIDVAARSQRKSILLSITHEDSGTEAEVIPNLVRRGVDSLIFNCRLVNAELYQAGDARTPRVLLDRADLVGGIPALGADLGQGARLATEHLAGHGHTRIGYIGGPLPADRQDYRRQSWHDVLTERGLPVPAPAITAWRPTGGFEGVRELFAGPETPTAIFAASDQIAIGAMHALHQLGLRIPDDVAVVSLDGTAETAYSWPPLTTVRQPFEAMAEAALAELASGSVTAPTERERVLFPMTLLLRASCGCREQEGLG
ncbi:LacI family DNA-binding transcriptional regulator [Acidipropionibacterium virtanenii]|uniref:Ribose operon repressor n=1 Tax=Acidipropionibacterium virtanenii TaxID=2057246 RepID=A0A344UXY3_9ACTN|nr:LacI family DNA-binding transcriptional regulator [Acidipropionibacterium virtanenii]AXE40131.1 Ribose operon repressor [Acidipropionibacterium virtanenii]